MSSRDLESYSPGRPAASGGPAQLADVLERVLDKGIVIAGDIQVNLLDIELLTVKLRLLIASADKAKEMGIDWWEGDAFLSRGDGQGRLEQRLRRLEQAAGIETEEREDESLEERSRR
ncbi:MAG TPA: gas vesicle protein [Gaiellaceae bacterium]|nr:gas vesicle protein [Gaiellaceae bacterium]